MQNVTFKFPNEIEFNRFCVYFTHTDCEINRKALTFKFKPTPYQRMVAIENFKAVIIDNNKYFF